ncbi:MAG: TylF/MycF/NovP-related O-methyltransferase [Polyangiales bacterium]
MSAAASNTDEQAIWDAYNLLLGGPDTERLRKLLARYALFQRTLRLPGDVVEAGVFKGTGLLFWLKLLRIHCPGSLKRCVGFDLFEGFEAAADDDDKPQVRALMDEAGFRGTSPEHVLAMVQRAGISLSRCELVAGDIRESAAHYVAEHPGFRISLLNLDLDLGPPTRAALEALWPRVVPGGVVIFDEYAVPHWSASQGIDAWAKDHALQLECLTWARSPTAYLIKTK